MKQVKYLLRGEKSKVHLDRKVGGLRAWGQFELLLRVISSGFSLANHFDVSGSQSIFGIISESSHVCAHIS